MEHKARENLNESNQRLRRSRATKGSKLVSKLSTAEASRRRKNCLPKLPRSGASKANLPRQKCCPASSKERPASRRRHQIPSPLQTRPSPLGRLQLGA